MAIRHFAAAAVVLLATTRCVPTSDSPLGITDGGGTGGTVPQAVNVHDNTFDPTGATVARNGSVRWTWRGRNQHSVTFDDGSQSQNPKSNGTFTRRFTDAGIFTYYCSVHGRDVMSGRVTVTAAPTP